MKINKLGNILLIILALMLLINVVSAGEDTLVGTDNGKLMVDSDSYDLVDDDNNGNVKLSASDSQVTLQASNVGNYTELQNLINSNPNSVITLDKDYVYSNSDSPYVEILNSITINGNGHNISGEGKTMSLYIPATTSQVILNNITFVNGYGNSMLWINGNDCLIDNCTFEDNFGSATGAIKIIGSSNVVNNSVFENNKANYYGGAIYIQGNNNIIDNCTFEENSADYSGGAICLDGSKNLIYNCAFENNRAKYYGGAIDNYNNYNVIDNCTFEDNFASYYGGAVYMEATDGLVNNSVFKRNSVDYYGGAIMASASNNVIDNSIFSENFVKNSQGSAAAVYVSADNVKILNSTFEKHTGNSGGAVYWLGSNGRIEDSKFNKNTANYGGALYWGASQGTIENTQFNENSASSGGALYVTQPNLVINKSKFSKNSAKNHAGAVYITTNGVTVSNSEFYENHANYAGAVEISGSDNTIDKSTFEYNYANNDGGAVIIAYPYSNPTAQQNNKIQASKFSHNNANTYGGAIRVDSQGNTIDESEFYYNKASIGGAVSFNAEHNTIDNSRFEYNEAINEGGAVNFNTEYLVINNSVLNYNKAIHGGAVYVGPWAYNAVVNNSQFLLNDALSNGGAIEWIAKDGTVDRSVFYNNGVDARDQYVVFGGAIEWLGNNAKINNSVFTWNFIYHNNGGSSQGGALALRGSDATVENCKFEHNRADSYGGAIEWDGANGLLYNSTFTENSAATQAGAINANGENLVINESAFTKNRATYLGGAVSLSVTATIDNSDFIKNSANKGGAVYWDADMGVVNNSYFYQNDAYYAGGAIASDYWYSNANKIIENSLFEENSATNYGGAIASLNTEVVNSTFKNNRANMGEAIHSYSTKISDDSTFINNDAVIKTTELIEINLPEDGVGNSTRKTNTSYIAMCVERYTMIPHLGLKDDSLDGLINILTGESIADYLKILVYTYFNSTDDVFPHEGDNYQLYPEGYFGHPYRWNYVTKIPRPDYFSRAVHDFSDREFWKSDHPVVKEVLRLYETVYGNGTKMPEKFIKEINGSLVEYKFSSMISASAQSLFLFDMVMHNMTVEKIALNNTVYLGDQTMFEIVVTNNGETNLTGIEVKETEYEGLKLVDFKADDLWQGNITTGIFKYNGILKPGENASFIVIFDTLIKGNITNVVVASSNQTKNKTANNTTEVVPVRVNVTKVWEDAQNHDGLRPESVTIYLLANGVKVNEAVLSKDNSWNYIFSDLAMIKDGKVIDYSITEKPVAHYKMQIINNTVDDFTIVVANNTYIFTVNNTHVPVFTDINVSKVWNDAYNQDAVRPSNVTVVLLANGEEVRTAVLDSTNDWKYVFNDLPVYEAGKEIEYSIDELDVANYTSAVSNNGVYDFTVTNTHVPLVTVVNVTKKWNDADNQDGLRPAGVTVVLLGGEDVVASAVLDGSNAWSASFENLPVYSNGNVISYTVQELDVDNYTSVISNDGAVWTVVNTHVPEITSVNVAKIWSDADNQDGLRPAGITVVLLGDGNVVASAVLDESNTWSTSFTNLPVYDNGNVISYSVEELDVSNYTSVISNDGVDWIVTNTHVPVVTDINVAKVWDDADNQDGVRPSSVTVVLLSNGNVIDSAVLDDSNAWSASFTNLPVYDNGNVISYSIEEISVANYSSVVSNDGSIWTVTNTHVPEITSVNVAKVWSDADNQDGLRPDSITVVLLGDGNVVASVVLDSDNNWAASFADLPVYNNGNVISYSVQELAVEEYVSEISNDSAYDFTVTNTHVPEITSVNVAKVWDDADNQDGLRPDSITVVLLGNGNVIDSAVLDDSNAWSASFSNLPVYSNGNVISYSVQELAVDDYASVISNDSAYDFTVTNTHVPEITSVNVVKVWNDNNNQYGVRPAGVTVILLADGNVIDSAVLDDSNAWSASFAGLPVYSNGNVIMYSIEEVHVANYMTQISNDDAYTYTVTNTHIPVITGVNITKVWRDTEDNDKISSTPVEVISYTDVVPVTNATLFPGEELKVPVDDEPVYNESDVVDYNISVAEDNITENVTEEGNFTVTEPVTNETVTDDTEDSNITEEVTDETVPPVEVPPSPETPVTDKHHVSKQVNDEHATGNPVLLLLLALFIPLIRRKEN